MVYIVDIAFVFVCRLLLYNNFKRGVMSQSMSVNVAYFDLVPYNSMVLTGPEVAIVFSIILVCSDVIVCGILVSCNG